MERLHMPSDWLERTELQLSVGQRQWVAIARALVLQPEILLLDEPTSALDVGRGEFLVKLLFDLNQQSQTTILMANHQLDLAAQFCDQVLHLSQGELIQNLSKQQIDWHELRQSLLQSDAQQIEEWG
jgi:D-methionine transport system ATP-binding protein